MKRLLHFLFILLLSGFFIGCEFNDHDENTTTLSSGVELVNMDISVSPQDDFYTYVNGTWLEKTEIPADRSSYSAFTEVYERTESNLQNIIDNISNKTELERNQDEEKIWKLYKSYMDTDTIEELGITPLQSLIDDISSVNSYSELITVMGELYMKQVTIPLSNFVSADAMDSENNILYFWQSGLGLPNRDYYLNSDDTFSEIQAKYKDYIKDIIIFTGFNGDAMGVAQDIYDLEYRLAEIQWSSEDNRDAIKTYNKLNVDEVDELMGDFDFRLFLESTNIYNVNDFIISQPSYFSGFGEMFQEIPLNTWKEYLIFHLVSDYATLLSSPFEDLEFSFYSTTINGVEEQKTREKKAIDFINQVLGELFGKIYVETYFPPEAKERMEKLVENLLISYDVSIDELTWMGDETKEAAREKLHKITTKIGYPDVWESYEDLEIIDDDLVGNSMRYAQYSYDKDISMIGKPVDHTKWYMLPQEVNAYYDPTSNEVVFPAAILQPPFFDMNADMAINYGAIGSVIGHEISHAFDDYGSKYDGDGNLNNWWTEEDAQRFEALGEKLVEQYNQYEPIPGYYINGSLTLGENMADLNGVSIGYKAYKISLDGNESTFIDGFTGEQRFFIGWAQIWRNKMREEELLRRLIVDPHSPAKYRVLGVFTNISGFYDAFDVKEGDEMYRPEEDRIKIW